MSHCLLLHLLLLLAVMALAMPPPPPIRCNATACVLTNSYGLWNDRRECAVAKVIYPKTEQEIIKAVADANHDNLKMKVVSGFSHTIPKLACPASPSVLISTLNYNSGIVIDAGDRTVVADSGVGLRELIDAVEAAGFSLVAAPYWEGVSVGGVVSTGAHGSSWWGKGGAVHDHVVGLRVVVPASKEEGYAKTVWIDDGVSDLFRAAKVSLGVLGVISKVKLSLEPRFKRSITNVFTDDARIEKDFIDHGDAHEFADITWYPSQHKAVYKRDDRVPMNASGDGVNDFIGFQSNLIAVSTAVRASEKALESTMNVKGKCSMAALEMNVKNFVANGLKNNGLIFTGYPVVGHQGKMQTSGSCSHSPAINILSTCAWDPRIKGLRFYETTAIFRASSFGDFVRNVKVLRDIKPENFCGVDLYNGFLIRFIKASDAYLGQAEDSVVVDFNYYRADEAMAPRLNQDVWEEVEQMAFFKYGARPHWAKNRNLAFDGVDKKYLNFNEFLAVKGRLDPQGMFSSEWSDEILFGRGTMKSDGCALEGLCVCSEDRHCSPEKGYLCKHGLVYEEARVCRYSPGGMSQRIMM
ncbi:hypothetical protein QJS04_geneDACA002723 [Acorus gramineus]|uniref:L-gulonolactone oxidase n=1 Tax=Acorus gramineus TaxID=55184 RepID=A0AAV9AQ02_ACOGR|nr:hypothetical protein QJS04_geneDACA002723 [Acorus gramineus]